MIHFNHFSSSSSQRKVLISWVFNRSDLIAFAITLPYFVENDKPGLPMRR